MKTKSNLFRALVMSIVFLAATAAIAQERMFMNLWYACLGGESEVTKVFGSHVYFGSTNLTGPGSVWKLRKSGAPVPIASFESQIRLDPTLGDAVNQGKHENPLCVSIKKFRRSDSNFSSTLNLLVGSGEVRGTLNRASSIEVQVCFHEESLDSALWQARVWAQSEPSTPLLAYKGCALEADSFIVTRIMVIDSVHITANFEQSRWLEARAGLQQGLSSGSMKVDGKSDSKTAIFLSSTERFHPFGQLSLVKAGGSIRPLNDARKRKSWMASMLRL